MSYISNRIKEKMATSESYRVAMNEEIAETERETKRREALMASLGKIRQERKLTQSEVAKAMNLSQARVSQLEKGSESFSLDRFLDYLDTVGVSISFQTNADSMSQNTHS